VARRGAGQVTRTPDPARREQSDPHARRSRSAADAEPDRWVEEAGNEPVPVRDSATRPPRSRPRRRLPEAVQRDLARAVGAKDAPAAEKRLLDAGSALDHDHPRDAIRLIRPLVKQAPDVAAVREVAGIASYRLGNWTVGAEHLEAFVRLSGSADLHPMLADCYRAIKRYRRANEVWDQLREASPSAEVVAEGRIVAAGALADQAKLAEAIALLERGPVKKRRTPADHHLRLWYALADLYERAGDTVRARELFTRVAEVDPSLADTVERLDSLR